MKHNKKRNTAFIYETLSRELTKSIVEKNNNKKASVLSIIKEHFSSDSVLAKELSLYRTLLETTNIHQNVAERMLQETKFAYSKLDSTEVFDAQSRIIAAINKQLGQNVWSNFVPNFKSLASVNAIFNTKTAVKSKVLFEQSIVDAMSTPTPLAEANKMAPLDNLTYTSFIRKFNDKYANLLQEQKELLNRYITSFADDGFELRLYLNEELRRLKENITTAGDQSEEVLISEKLGKVSEYLDEFRKREFTDEDLNKVLKAQELVQELSAND
tara:strand:- start:1351 stop:2163 length:813 start_codon:yes stop_codon:yes gene_type:complete